MSLRLPRSTRFRIRLGLLIVILGLIVFVLGVNPNIFSLDRSPITGFLQIAVFLVGLAMICIGGYMTLNALWNGREKSIAADIGFRTISTGYVISVASGMADVFGFGTHVRPRIPYFGPWQAIGVMAGEFFIILGFLLMIPYPPKKTEEQKQPE